MYCTSARTSWERWIGGEPRLPAPEETQEERGSKQDPQSTSPNLKEEEEVGIMN